MRASREHLLLLAAGVGGLALAAALRRARATRPPRRRVFVMRHGEKQKNTPDRDNFTAELLPEAVAQLEALRGFLRDGLGVEFQVALTSPYLRCRRTAAALTTRASIEPGLSESLGAATGLRDGSGDGGTIEKLIGRVQALVEAEARVGDPPALVGASELEAEVNKANPQCMTRTFNFVRRLLARHASADAYPMLLVAHGASSWGVTQSFLAGADGPVPSWDKNLCWPMTSCVVLEEDPGHPEAGAGGWRVVGHALPVLADDGQYECRWRPGQPKGADPTQL